MNVLASELVRWPATLLIATDWPSALAVKAATTTIPIVFGAGEDPVQLGLVASRNRPGGNATGASVFTTELGSKRLGLLRKVIPKPGLIAFVVNPNSAMTPAQVESLQAAAQSVAQLPLVCLRAPKRKSMKRSRPWRNAMSPESCTARPCFSRSSAISSSRSQRSMRSQPFMSGGRLSRLAVL